jgi:hypothetical protein
MKLLQVLAILVFISSCNGTKQITQTPSKEGSKPETIKDSITIETINVLVKNDSTEVPDTQKPEDLQLNTEEKARPFNHNNWTILLQKHVSKQGNVNYNGFKTDRKALLNYITSLGKNIPDDTWTKNAKLAYWINAYNVLTIDLILRHYPIKSIKDIKKPWEQRYWKLGNKWFNLNEIEHDILRKMNEPRIHFAIVCASFSCPKLQNKAFEASNLEEQLSKATKEFLRDSTRNELSENTLNLSKIFQWFSKDFKQNGALINFLNQYSDVKISNHAKKRFMDYNWDLNE